MEYLPLYAFGALFVGMLALIIYFNGKPRKNSHKALEDWAAQWGYHYEDGKVRGRASNFAFTAETQRKHEMGSARMVPVMTFNTGLKLPETEMRHRGFMGMASVIHRISGLQPFKTADHTYANRTHDLWSTNLDFIRDAWDNELGMILVKPHSSLSYRLTPEGLLEVYDVGGLMPAWTTNSLCEAAASGNQLCQLITELYAKQTRMNP